MDNFIETAAVLRRVILLVLTVYLLITGILYVFQTNLIFFRQRIDPWRVEYIKNNYPEAEEVYIDTPDGKKLHGWLVHSSQEEPAPLLLYFGGNAEEVSWMIDEADRFTGWSILLINYRGYGKSGGSPDEQALFSDALLLYDTFSVRKEIDPERIAVMGRSLGTAMAVHISASRKVTHTVLVSPFGSMEDLARSNFPFIPVRLLLKYKFDVLPQAASAGNPMLTLAASEDSIVPLKHSERLFAAWKGQKVLHVIDHADHNTISFSRVFWNSIRRFLNNQSQAGTGNNVKIIPED